MKKIAMFLGALAGIAGVTFLIFGPEKSGGFLKILFWALILGSAIPFQKAKKGEEPISYLFWSKKPSAWIWPPESWRGFIGRRLCLQLGWGIVNQRPFPARGFVFKEVRVSDLDIRSANGKSFPVGGRVVLDLKVVDPYTMASAMGESVKGLGKKTLKAVREGVKTASRSFPPYSPTTFDLAAYETDLEAEVNSCLAILGLEVRSSSLQFPTGKTAPSSEKEDKGQSAGAKFLEGLIGAFLKGVGKLVYEFLNLLRNPLDIFRGKETIEELGAKIRWRMGASAFSLLVYLLLFFLWSGMWRQTWLAEWIAGPAPVAQTAQDAAKAQTFQPERPSGGEVSRAPDNFHPGVFQIPPLSWGGEFRKELKGQNSFRIGFKEKADQENFQSLLEVSVLDAQGRVVRNRLRVGDWHPIPDEEVVLQVNFIDFAKRAPSSGIEFDVETR